jgi:tetratricopeptide (TPR) repeat protein
VLRGRASLASSAEEQAQCLADIELALAAANEPVEKARLLMCRAHLRGNQAQFRKVIADAVTAMQLFEASGEAEGAIDAASAAAACASRLDDLSMASDLAAKCIVALPTLANDALRAEVANRLGAFCVSFGDYDHAIRQFEESLAAAEHCGDQRFVYRELYNLADTLLLAAHLDNLPGTCRQRAGSRACRLAHAERVLERMAEEGNEELAAWAGLRRMQAQLLYVPDREYGPGARRGGYRSGLTAVVAATWSGPRAMQA